MKTNNTCTTFKVGRKDAEDQLKRELRGDISVNPEKRVDEIQDKKSQRKRKKKSYGTDFEEDDSTSETEENDGMYILTLVSGGNRARTGHWASEKNGRSYPVSPHLILFQSIHTLAVNNQSSINPQNASVCYAGKKRMP